MRPMPQQQSAANPLKSAWAYGQSIWYDGLIEKSEFEKMIREDGVRGATTNPTIFEKAIATGAYDAEIKALSGKHSVEEIYKKLAVKAVQDVADLFKALYDESKGTDGFVSIEVSPLLAYETVQTITEAQELWRLVNRKNVMIKVPATLQGIPAIEALISEGINVNVTLIFSVERYKEVMNAYIEGLEKRAEEGDEVSGIASVASFFVSRVDAVLDKEIEAKIPLEKDVLRSQMLKSLMGHVGIANSKLAYREFEKTFQSERFQKLKKKNAQSQRPLWASTGTKNPNYSDVLYVEALMGPQTVNTIPPATMDAFRDHGHAESRLKENMPEAQHTMEKLKSSGIDIKKITQKLEDQGVELFCDSYKKIIQALESKK